MNRLSTFCPYAFLFLFLSCSHSSVKAQNSTASELIVKRPHYELSYNEDHEVANWVFYTLEHKHLRGCVKRKNDFRPDPLVVTGSAELDDYKGSGFDRGHLIPAGDMKFDGKAMSDTFYLSNMTPQPPRFNQGMWARLEYLMRAWALKYKKIWIVTGPVLHKGLPVIGKTNQVSVPDEYYKVILRKEGSRFVGIGFLMSTSLPHNQLDAYAVDIDTVEKIAGIDFFPFLSKKEEREAEGRVENLSWDFKAQFAYLPCRSSGVR